MTIREHEEEETLLHRDGYAHPRVRSILDQELDLVSGVQTWWNLGHES